MGQTNKEILAYAPKLAAVYCSGFLVEQEGKNLTCRKVARWVVIPLGDGMLPTGSGHGHHHYRACTLGAALEEGVARWVVIPLGDGMLPTGSGHGHHHCRA